MAAPSPVEPSSRSQALHAELHQLYLLAASEQDGAAYVPLDSDDRASYRGLALAQYTTWVAKSTFSLAEFSAESSAISAMTDQGILGASLVVVCALVCDYFVEAQDPSHHHTRLSPRLHSNCTVTAL